MKIQEDGEEKISVTLTKSDMTELDITYEELDYSNIETRRVIWTILDEAKKTLGKCVNTDNRLLIQVSPENDGGCRLQFITLPDATDQKRRRLIMKKDEEQIIFCPFDKDALTDSFDTLKALHSEIKDMCFFEYNNKTYVIVQPKISFTEKIIFSLSEFGEALVPSRRFLNEILEYARPYLKESTAFLTSEEPNM